jgi:hypothetical protein
MGGRIPKSAQRAIDKANQQRRIFETAQTAAARGVTTPRKMEVGVTPRGTMNMFEVYFNDEKQLLCTLADVDSGTIRRWNAGAGNRPAKGAVQELLQGKVEIRPRAR